MGGLTNLPELQNAEGSPPVPTALVGAAGLMDGVVPRAGALVGQGPCSLVPFLSQALGTQPGSPFSVSPSVAVE